MNERDHSQIATTLAPLMAMYPNWKPERETLKLYAMVLSDIDEALLEEAIVVLLTDPKDFMPVAGAIRDAALTLVNYREGDPNVYTAWSQVTGYFNGRKDVHPLVDETAKLIGGWRAIGQSTNLPSERARFIEAYRELVKERRQKARMLPRTRRFIGEEETGKLQLADEKPKAIKMFADDVN
jgi:hypothetical protein